MLDGRRYSLDCCQTSPSQGLLLADFRNAVISAGSLVDRHQRALFLAQSIAAESLKRIKPLELVRLQVTRSDRHQQANLMLLIHSPGILKLAQGLSCLAHFPLL
jgi:hypothetical protein